MKTPAQDDLLAVGTIVGTHGLKGDLRVRPHSGSADSLAEAREVFLTTGRGAPRAFAVRRAAPHKGNVLLRLAGHEDIDSAQELVGSDILLPAGALPALSDDEFYWFQLQGIAVQDRQRGDLGLLEEMFTTPAHDIYVVRGRFGEVLIPAVDALVVAVDLEGRRMTVDLPEGLVPTSDDL